MRKLNRDRNFFAIFFAALFRPSRRILRFPFFSLGRSSFPIRSCLFRAAPFPASHPHPSGLSDLFVLPFLSPFFSRPSSRAYSHLFFAKVFLVRFASSSGFSFPFPDDSASDLHTLFVLCFPRGCRFMSVLIRLGDFAPRPPVLPLLSRSRSSVFPFVPHRQLYPSGSRSLPLRTHFQLS